MFQTDVQDSCTYELTVYTRIVQDEAKSNPGLDRELGVKFSLSQGAIFSWYLLIDEESKVKICYQAAEDKGNDSLKDSHRITLDDLFENVLHSCNQIMICNLALQDVRPFLTTDFMNSR